MIFFAPAPQRKTQADGSLADPIRQICSIRHTRAPKGRPPARAALGERQCLPISSPRVRDLENPHAQGGRHRKQSSVSAAEIQVRA